MRWFGLSQAASWISTNCYHNVSLERGDMSPAFSLFRAGRIARILYPIILFRVKIKDLRHLPDIRLWTAASTTLHQRACSCCSSRQTAMATFQITTAVLGVLFAAVILYLIRGDRLYLRLGLFWFALSMLAVLLGVWPRMLDNIADQLGIRYSPTLLLVCAVGVLFVKALHADMVNTRIERQVRRLNQSLALLQIKNQQSPAISPLSSPPIIHSKKSHSHV